MKEMHHYYSIRITHPGKGPSFRNACFILCINILIQTITPLFIMCYILTQNLRYMTKTDLEKVVLS